MNSRESLSPSHNPGAAFSLLFLTFVKGGCVFRHTVRGFFSETLSTEKRKENEMQLYDVNRQIEELLARLEPDPETG